MWKKDREFLLTRKFTSKKEKNKPRRVNKGDIDLGHKLLFEIVNKELFPRGWRRSKANLGI